MWGNQDGHGMQPNGLSDELWQTVEQDLKHFLQHHSLKNNALGPSHMAEKPWAVRTRRVSNVTSNPNLPSTSVMDDEDAAIAAAIAASLHDPLQSDVFDSSSSHDDHDNNSPDMSSESSESFNGDDEHELDSVSDEQEGKSEQDTEQPILREENNLNNTLMSMPVPPPLTRTSIVTQGSRDPLASSVESISSSYLERMDSRFRSSTNPSLMEDRRLRQEQDAELAACLQEDRSRDEMEQAKEAVQAHMKEQKLAAAARLPDEPAEKAVDIFTIAIRLEDGKKIIRRFNSFDKLRSVADFAIAETGNSTLTQFVPSSKLKVPGFNLGDAGWEVALQDLGLSRRTMFFLNM